MAESQGFGDIMMENEVQKHQQITRSITMPNQWILYTSTASCRFRGSRFTVIIPFQWNKLPNFRTISSSVS